MTLMLLSFMNTARKEKVLYGWMDVTLMIMTINGNDLIQFDEHNWGGGGREESLGGAFGS